MCVCGGRNFFLCLIFQGRYINITVSYQSRAVNASTLCTYGIITRARVTRNRIACLKIYYKATLKPRMSFVLLWKLQMSTQFLRAHNGLYNIIILCYVVFLWFLLTYIFRLLIKLICKLVLYFVLVMNSLLFFENVSINSSVGLHFITRENRETVACG